MATCRGKTEPPMKVADFANVSLAKTRPRLDEWATVMRARERNVPRTRSVGCSSRGAQNPHRPHTREPGAPAAARPAPPPIEATEIRATRSRLLDVAASFGDG